MDHRAAGGPIAPSWRGSDRHIELVGVLGRGGFGEVYLADLHGQDGFVQRVALKVLHARATAEADFVARQRDEARLLAQLHHESIVRVLDLMQVDGRPAVVMEYVEGVDSGRLARAHTFPPRAAFELCASVARALDAAWSTTSPRTTQPLRVVHRDLKPSNLVVTVHGSVKVLDFGIARADFDREGQTQSVMYGTPRYMAPEQWLENRADAGVDIYALGFSLAELLRGGEANRLPLDPSRHQAEVATLLAALPLGTSPAAVAARALLTAMLQFRDVDRPSALDVAERAQELAPKLEGDSLARFARGHVRDLITVEPLPASLLGPLPTAIPDATRGAPASVPAPPSVPGVVPRAAAPQDPLRPPVTGTLPVPRRRASLRGVWAGIAAVVLVGVAAWAIGQPPVAPAPGPDATHAAEDGAAAIPAAPAQEAPTAPGAPASVDDVPTTTPPGPRRAPTAPIRAPGPSTAPVEAPATLPPSVGQPVVEAASHPDPEPLAILPERSDAPAEVAAVPKLRTVLSSNPLGAAIAVDGVARGTTPVELELPAGTHHIRWTLHGASAERTVTIGRRLPSRYVWNVASGEVPAFVD